MRRLPPRRVPGPALLKHRSGQLIMEVAATDPAEWDGLKACCVPRHLRGVRTWELCSQRFVRLLLEHKNNRTGQQKARILLSSAGSWVHGPSYAPSARREMGGSHWEDPWQEESPTHRAAPPRAHTQHACTNAQLTGKGLLQQPPVGKMLHFPLKPYSCAAGSLDLPVRSSPRAQRRQPQQGHPTCPCLPPMRLLAKALLHSSRLGRKPLLTKGRIPQVPSL